MSIIIRGNGRPAWPAIALAFILSAVTVAHAQNNAQLLARNAYPTGDPSTSVIGVERFGPPQIRLGEEFVLAFKITNLTTRAVENVTYTEELPPNFTLTRAEPQPSSTAGMRLSWVVGNINPREAKLIRVFGTAQTLGELGSCGTVTFSTTTCSTVTVVQPQLVLNKQMPPEVTLCDPIPIKLVVQNVGTGMAQDVRVTDTLPDGWTTMQGDRQVQFNAGNLPAGQAREFTLTARASAPGNFVNQSVAMEATGLRAEASASTHVTRPALSVTKTGPNVRYIGRPATFQLTVTNNGDAPARDTVLVDHFPPGFVVNNASDGAQAGSNFVRWNLGVMQPGQSRTVSVTMTPNTRGDFENRAEVKAYCAEAAASIPITAKGIPAILLEVIDLEDPIERGADTTYVIRVFNQGSANGTNIVLRCEIPTQQQLVNAAGQVDASATGNVVEFLPLPVLPPKAEAVYRVTVKGVGTGDVRFKVTMSSDQLDRPVEETESTHIYE